MLGMDPQVAKHPMLFLGFKETRVPLLKKLLRVKGGGRK